jgi:hypothetical protein
MADITLFFICLMWLIIGFVMGFNYAIRSCKKAISEVFEERKQRIPPHE